MYLSVYLYISLYGLDDDLLPRYYCCAASEDPAFCGYYEEKRPAGSCDGYLPPRTGWMFGDPHMRTLDGYSYTFNGMGEYTLIEFNHGMFELQGRMERAWSDGDDINGTVFTAFAAKVQGSTTVSAINLTFYEGHFHIICFIISFVCMTIIPIAALNVFFKHMSL